MTINKCSFEERLFLVNEIIKNKKAINFVSKQSGVHKDTLSEWVRRYRAHGEETLQPFKKKYFYSEKTKQNAVEEVLYMSASKRSIVRKYNISSKSVLLSWISNYTKKKQLKDTGRGLSQMNSKKSSKETSLAERIEIVQYTLACNTDYQAAIKKYGVSYQQIYIWVKKYNSLGIQGLQDKRGRNTPPPEELSELDKLRLENKQLKARNDYLEMDHDFTKKLQELRQRYTTFR